MICGAPITRAAHRASDDATARSSARFFPSHSTRPTRVAIPRGAMSSEVDRVLAWETSSDSASVPESLTNLLRLAEEAGEEHAALAGNPEADVSELNALARQAENLTTGEEPEQEAKIVFDGLMGYHAKLERDRSELAIAAERRQFAHASNASNAADAILNAIDEDVRGVEGGAGADGAAAIAEAKEVRRRLDWSLDETRRRRERLASTQERASQMRRAVLHNTLADMIADDMSDEEDDERRLRRRALGRSRAEDVVEEYLREQAARRARAYGVASPTMNARSPTHGGAHDNHGYHRGPIGVSPSKSVQTARRAVLSPSKGVQTSPSIADDDEDSWDEFFSPRRPATRRGRTNSENSEASTTTNDDVAGAGGPSTPGRDGGMEAEVAVDEDSPRRKHRLSRIRRRIIRDILVAAPAVVFSVMEALRGGSPRKEGGATSLRGQSPRKGHFLGVGKKSPKKEAKAAARDESSRPPTVMKVEAVEYAAKSIPDQITPVMVEPPASVKRRNEDRELRKVFGMG